MTARTVWVVVRPDGGRTVVDFFTAGTVAGAGNVASLAALSPESDMFLRAGFGDIFFRAVAGDSVVLSGRTITCRCAGGRPDGVEVATPWRGDCGCAGTALEGPAWGRIFCRNASCAARRRACSARSC